MGPGEGAIGEGEDGDDHEEDEDPNQAGVKVTVPVSCLVPGEGCVSEAKDAYEHGGDGVRLVELMKGSNGCICEMV